MNDINSIETSLYENCIDVMDLDKNKKLKGFFYFFDEFNKDFAQRVFLDIDPFESDKQSAIYVTTLETLKDENFSKFIRQANALLFCDKSYSGKETDLEKLAGAIIIYFGENIQRFERYFKKYGWITKL